MRYEPTVTNSNGKSGVGRHLPPLTSTTATRRASDRMPYPVNRQSHNALVQLRANLLSTCTTQRLRRARLLQRLLGSDFGIFTSSAGYLDRRRQSPAK